MSLLQFVGLRRRNLEMVTLSIAAHIPIHQLRLLVIRLWGGRIEPGATVYHGFQMRNARRLTIGARSSIGDGAILDARGGLTIGRDVNLSTQVHIWTAQHGWNDPDFAFESAPVVIGDHVWLGARVSVLPGVTIGEGAVVATGSVVTKSLEPYGLYAGVPAKRLRDRERVRYQLPDSRHKVWWW